MLATSASTAEAERERVEDREREAELLVRVRVGHSSCQESSKRALEFTVGAITLHCIAKQGRGRGLKGGIEKEEKEKRRSWARS